MTNGKNNNSRVTKKTAVITVGFDIFLIIATIVILHFRDVETLSPIRAMNVGIDLVCMIIGFLLLLFCYIDLQRVGVDFKSFRYMVQATILALFTDACAWVMENRPELWLLNRIDNTVFYLTMPTVIYCFWRYVTQIIGRDEPLVKKAELFLKLGYVVEMLLCVANFFFGFFFTIDHQGVYHRGALFPLFMLYTVVLLILVVALLVTSRKRLTGKQIIAIATYLATPFPIVFISIFVYGLSLNYAICMLDMLVMYCILNIEQGREKLAVEKELSTASSIQEGVLPHVFPLFPERKEFDLHASMDPAKEVGGDFYDAFFIDDDHMALVIADVSGKGIPAALFMLISRTLIKNRAMMGGTPAEILMDVNPQLFEGNQAKMFVTVWLGILTVSTGHVVEVNAGHEHPAIRRANGEFELLKRKHGFVLGGRKKIRYTDDEFDLAPGDALFVYTDGVPEATDSKGERFGMDRMIAALNKRADGTPEELLAAVRTDVDAFVGSAPQFDDLTMLAVKYYDPEIIITCNRSDGIS